MSSRQGVGSSPIPADIVARDRDGKAVLVVEVKAPKSRYISESPDSRLLEWASDHPEGPFPYLMVANVDNLLLFRKDRVPSPRDVPQGSSQPFLPDLALST